jgi:hypothetical protein
VQKRWALIPSSRSGDDIRTARVIASLRAETGDLISDV